MRKLLKSRKGFDWSFLIVIVTIICVVFLFIQLNKKIENFDKPIGEMQLDVINMVKQGDNLLFYLGQSGRLSACDTIYDFAEKGGFDSPPCGQTLPFLEQGAVPMSYTYSFWYKDGNKCYENINFYKEFKRMFDNKLRDHIVNYNFFRERQAHIPPGNYEFMITDDLIVGSAIKNIELKKAAVVAGELGAGRYVFKPSFAIDFKTGINDYFKIQPAVDSLITCEKPMQDCITDINIPGLKWSFDLLNPTTYLIKVEQESVNCRFTPEKPIIRFAIEKPVTTPEIAATPPVPAPPIPVP